MAAFDLLVKLSVPCVEEELLVEALRGHDVAVDPVDGNDGQQLVQRIFSGNIPSKKNKILG